MGFLDDEGSGGIDIMSIIMTRQIQEEL